MNVLSTIRKEWFGRGVFLGSGNFTELVFSVTEVIVGLHVLIEGKAGASYSTLADKIDNVIPLWIAGVMFLVSGILTLTGVYIYLAGIVVDKAGNVFRLVGAFCSIFVWLFAGMTLFPSPFMYIYFTAVIAAMRTTVIIKV